MSPALAGGFLTTRPPGKPENYVLMGEHSEIAWGDCSKEVRNEPGYRGVFAIKTK